MEQSNGTSKLEKLNVKLSGSNYEFLQKIERRLKSSDIIKSPLIKHIIINKDMIPEVTIEDSYKKNYKL